LRTGAVVLQGLKCQLPGSVSALVSKSASFSVSDDEKGSSIGSSQPQTLGFFFLDFGFGGKATREL
jgi:hypothetical protein